jgi:hypothetical protein
LIRTKLGAKVAWLQPAPDKAGPLNPMRRSDKKMIQVKY